MHIAFFSDSYLDQVNGVAYTVHLWAEEIRRLGHRVSIFYPKNSRGVFQEEYPISSLPLPGYSGYRIGLPGIAHYGGVLADVDVIHSHMPFPIGTLGLLAARRHSVPFAASFHTPMENYAQYLSRFSSINAPFFAVFRAWERYFYRQAVFRHAPSEYIANFLREKGIPSVTAISCGIQADRFSSPDASGIRERFGLEAEGYYGYCGRLSREKNVSFLISVSDRLDKPLLVIGDGPDRKMLERKAEGKPVTFLPFLSREEYSNVYDLFDAFLFASTAETQGLVALEANASGVPVVGVDAMALSHTVIEGETGCLFQPGDSASFFSALDRAKEVSSSACKRYAGEHDVKVSVEKLLEVYGVLLQGQELVVNVG